MNHKNEKVMQVVLFLIACISTVSVLLICIFLLSNGLPAVKEIGVIKFLFEEVWCPPSNEFGILPMVVGSLYVTLGILVISVLIGILTAVFMVYFCPNKLYKSSKTGINLMADIPSIVHGFFDLVVSVSFVRDYIDGYDIGALTAAIFLGTMILPTTASAPGMAIRAVFHYYYEGGLALGASHGKGILLVVLSAARRGLLAATIFGPGCTVGGIIAIIMVVDNQAVLPKALTSGMKTLTTNIITKMGYSMGLHREVLIGTAVVLFIFVPIISICFSLLYKEE